MGVWGPQKSVQPALGQTELGVLLAHGTARSPVRQNRKRSSLVPSRETWGRGQGALGPGQGCVSHVTERGPCSWGSVGGGL